jgi:serine/threonine-protein kinase
LAPLTLASGTRLGPYEIVSALGAGGMGEVYRAKDTKLGRDVALKILPASFTNDPERVARFRREAQVLASLNHPHIGAIYSLDEANGTQFLVLELVDGESLDKRIARGPIPVDEALGIARQIAEALAPAHEKGIIHRDLKPANIALTKGGQVKVLDFGLAKAVETTSASFDPMNSPTITSPAMMTGVGALLGTAAYMSPEQAKGRAADKRSDIWAVGCVLYEMLTGHRAYVGDDTTDTLAAVLRGEPDWRNLPLTLPMSVSTLLRSCLAKDREHRVSDVAVVEYVLRETLAPANASTQRATGTLRNARLLRAAVAIVVIMLAGTAGWFLRPVRVETKPVTRFSIGVDDQRFTSIGRHIVALSANGRRLAYIVNNQIILRDMDRLAATPINGADGPLEPFFSPDGEWIAYSSGGHLKKISVTGGAPTLLCEAGAPYGMPWWDRDRIVFAEGPDGIFEVPASGGVATRIVKANPGEFLHGPQILPDGQTILFTLGTAKSLIDRWSGSQIVAASLKTGERKTLVNGGTDGRYLPTGHLVYARNGVVYAARFDPSRLAVSEPTAMIEGVALADGGATGAAQIAFSTTGTIVYQPATNGETTILVWRDRSGHETAINAPPHVYETPRVSPDGTRIAVRALDQDNDIWVWDTRSENLTRLTFDKARALGPVWTSDSRRIIFMSSRQGAPALFWQPADGAGQPDVLLPPPAGSNGALVANAVTPDGRELIYSVGVPSDVMVLSLDKQPNVRPVVAQPQFAERGADISPDGRWLAYYSDESGTFEVYVRPYPRTTEGRWQISTDGGSQVRWNPAGRELFFVDGRNRLIAVPAQTNGATFTFGKPSPLLDISDANASIYRNYDVSSDGTRFILTKSLRSKTPPQLVAVENWFDELNRRVPAK